MHLKPIAITLSLILSSACAARAAQPTLIGEFDDWGVYSVLRAFDIKGDEAGRRGPRSQFLHRVSGRGWRFGLRA
jgi:hypothetical protein